MKHRLIIIITSIYLVIFAFSYTIINVQASTTRVDTTQLDEASRLISSKHYYRGYVKFKSMAQHGCPFSQCILGIMHQKGLGVKKNPAQALYWFKKSAQQGFADAEHRLGLMYYYGDGVRKNLSLAKQWLSKAADHGVENAKQLLVKIPHANELSNNLAQLPNNAALTIGNIRQSWQGYSQLTQQMEQLSSVASSK